MPEVIDGRIGTLNLRVTANRATTFTFTFGGPGQITFTTASLWFGGDGVGGDLSGATEYPMTVIGNVAAIELPAFEDELYFPLRLTLDDEVYAIGGLWVDPDGLDGSTRDVVVLMRDVVANVTVVGGAFGTPAVEVREGEPWPPPDEQDNILYLRTID